jgi:hypothetical protein
MSLHRAEPTTNVIKLMDACGRCERLFASIGKYASKPELRELGNDVKEALFQFRFELQKELVRLHANLPSASAESPDAVPPNELVVTSRLNLEQTLATYRTVLRAHMPAHSRAMIRRQCSRLEEFEQALERLARAA